jgi:primosomal protein N' (replication factor Y)
VLDDEPILNTPVLDVLAWIAEYYEAPLADVVSLAVGRRLTAGSKRFVRLLDAALARSPVETQIVEALREGGAAMEAGRLRRRFGAKPVDGALRALSARGAVAIDERLVEAATQELRETWVAVACRPDEMLAEHLFARAPKRRELFEFVARQPGRAIAMRKLAEAFPSPSAQVATLVEAGVLQREEREVYREVEVAPETVSHANLSAEQTAAVDAIVGTLGSYVAFLLQGVTASGKTEVYLRAIAAALERNTNALVLVPEISLTHQVVARLVGRFGPTVAVLHSELSAGERWDEWRRIRRREVRIVVGARSAVLAPIDDLGIVVVDEEHDGAFKQEDGVRYNARDVAVVRARKAGCPIVLGSATPSIESWRSAREGRYRRLVLPTRVTGGTLPSVEVVDLRGRDIEATGGNVRAPCRADAAQSRRRRPDAAVPQPPRLRGKPSVLRVRRDRPVRPVQRRHDVASGRTPPALPPLRQRAAGSGPLRRLRRRRARRAGRGHAAPGGHCARAAAERTHRAAGSRHCRAQRQHARRAGRLARA